MRLDEHGIPIIGPEPENHKAEERAYRKAQGAYEAKQISLQNRIFWTQIGIVAFGLIASGVSLWQASTAQQSADTSDKSVLVAQRTERNSVRTSEMARIESNRAASFAADEAKKALGATIEKFHQEQRAWVGKKGFSDNSFPKLGAVFQPTVIVENTGKTPALKLRTLASLSYLPSSTLFAPKFLPSSGLVSIGVLPPNTIATIQLDNSWPGHEVPPVFTPENLQSITDGSMVMYIFGVVTYEDVFGLSHVSHFCDTLSRDLQHFSMCTSYNDEQ